jgi:hypothetical protein
VSYSAKLPLRKYRCSTPTAETHAPVDVPMVSPQDVNDWESPEITCPISNDTKVIRKSGVELVLPHDGQHSYSGTIIQFPSEKHEVIKTYTAVMITARMYLGTATNGGIVVWRDMHIEYIDGALVAVTLKLSNTTNTLPNPPTGESIALRSPPTLPPE